MLDYICLRYLIAKQLIRTLINKIKLKLESCSNLLFTSLWLIGSDSKYGMSKIGLPYSGLFLFYPIVLIIGCVVRNIMI